VTLCSFSISVTVGALQQLARAEYRCYHTLDGSALELKEPEGVLLPTSVRVGLAAEGATRAESPGLLCDQSPESAGDWTT
jgi:hypothetical protein